MELNELLKNLKRMNEISGHRMGNIVLYDDGSGRYTSNAESDPDKGTVFNFNSLEDLVKKLK